VDDVLDEIGSEVAVEAGRGSGRIVRIAGAAAVLMLVLSGCSSKEEVLESTPADQLYNEGLVSLEAGKRVDAAKKFEDVDRLHPFSPYGKKAILMQAYTQFQRNAYTDAIQSAQRYVTLFPTSPDAAYAQYLIAESYYRQMPEVSRDQQRTGSALEAYADLIKKYPTSPYAEDAKKKILLVKDQLAGKEMDVGRFYLQQRRYLAAINRFKVVVSEYQTTRHVEEALARLVECYYALGIVSEAKTAAAVLGHNFPDSQWYRDSYSLLAKGGYEPGEDSGSWISKAFNATNVKLF
jgi:outer membrane protein assembly factor BamD